VDPVIDSSCFLFPYLTTETGPVAGTEYDTVDKVKKSYNTVAWSSILLSEVVLCRSMLKLSGIRRTHESLLNQISHK
jgi:hypothetical protein